MRRIGGPLLTVLYNVLNALLFCVLAGCMITVSASAVRIPFGIPPQTQWYPTDARFVIAVCVVGAVVVWLAIAGFKRLAAFATVCSPWMLLMFIAGALVMLPGLGESTGVGSVRSLSQFWELGEKAIWIGRTPDGGLPLIGFWHVAAFAWICNLAMHMGLSDMAIFRYARRTTYGFFSVFGMFLGHYLAWIAAGRDGRRRRLGDEHAAYRAGFGCRSASGSRRDRRDRGGYRRLDNVESHALSRRPGVAGCHAGLATLAGDAGGRHRHHPHRLLPVRVYRTAEFRGDLRVAAGAGGRGRHDRALALPAPWIDAATGRSSADYCSIGRLWWPGLPAWRWLLAYT